MNTSSMDVLEVIRTRRSIPQFKPDAIPRTVLEWRLEPDGEFRSPYVGGCEDRILLICDHGHSTILAAATLVDLGFSRAGDVVGGFEAWREAGLPVKPGPSARPAPGERPGMGPPEPA